MNPVDITPEEIEVLGAWTKPLGGFVGELTTWWSEPCYEALTEVSSGDRFPPASNIYYTRSAWLRFVKLDSEEGEVGWRVYLLRNHLDYDVPIAYGEHDPDLKRAIQSLLKDLGWRSAEFSRLRCLLDPAHAVVVKASEIESPRTSEPPIAPRRKPDV